MEIKQKRRRLIILFPQLYRHNELNVAHGNAKHHLHKNKMHIIIIYEAFCKKNTQEENQTEFKNNIGQ